MNRQIAALLRIGAASVLIVSAPGIEAAPASQPPDLSGVWSAIWEPQKIDPKLLPALPGTPRFTPAFKAKYTAMLHAESQLEAENRIDPKSVAARAETSCLPVGMPSMMQADYSLEILQAPHQVTLISEAPLEVRRIYLNKPQLSLDEVAPGYAGRSVGHWEGDTLVVDTIGVKAEHGFGMLLPHSSRMKISERIRLVTPELLQDQVTIEDPLALERPYAFTYLLVRLHDYETPEYVCDNNRESVNEKGEVVLKLQQGP